MTTTTTTLREKKISEEEIFAEYNFSIHSFISAGEFVVFHGI